MEVVVYGLLALGAVLGLVELGFQLFASPEHRRRMAEIERLAKERLRKERLEAMRRDRVPLVSRREPPDRRRLDL